MGDILEHRGRIRIVAVSCRESNLLLIRVACAAQLADHSFHVLDSNASVDDYVGALTNEPPQILLLDLDTAPEASWWCVERLPAQTNASKLSIFGLTDASERAQTRPTLGRSISAVLEIPRTADEATALVKLMTVTRVERTMRQHPNSLCRELLGTDL